MKRSPSLISGCLSSLLCIFVAVSAAGCHDSDSSGGAAPAQPAVPEGIGDAPVIASHLDQSEILAGDVSMDAVIDHGRTLFAASFNTLDGAGRPETTGTGTPRARRESPENFNRISGPDANSCAGCHNVPAVGGGGDNVANVFVLGQRLPFVNFDGGEGDGGVDQTLKGVANERNTLGMFGAGFVELLAREMTSDLQAIRAVAIEDAAASGVDMTRELVTKGVDFGTIRARPDGSVDTSGVEGVDADLVIKPFHQKGAVVSLREFTNNAMNHHHGIQTAERFGAGADPDRDEISDELTVGDVTAATLFQATLPVPGVVLPLHPDALDAVKNGEALFDAIGCASCHMKQLRLTSPVFTDPNPFNPAGNLRPIDVPAPVAVDLTTAGAGPHLNKEPEGSVLVPLFSDLKRHDMGEDLDNELLVQAGIPTAQWLTRKLWGFANEPPFLHHGRALLIGDAIRAHGGEGAAAREAFDLLLSSQQAEIVEYLKTLQVLPEGSTSRVQFAATSGVIGDAPAMPVHMSQARIDDGDSSVDELFEHGKNLFRAMGNDLDGAKRPESTGTGAPRERREGVDAFNRISADDANSCAGCHNVPRAAGGGDNVANVFVLGQRFPFLNFDGGAGDNGDASLTLKTAANERNTLGMFGAGYIELLAREMTEDLQAIRAAAQAEAVAGGVAVTRSLDTKGVNFGSITALPNGSFSNLDIEGVDADLVIKPFHQKGAVISLREFSNNAFNHHHGLQSEERFGPNIDADQDDFDDEVTVGDITAVTIYQAALAVPGRVMPESAEAKKAVARGEQLFEEVGCARCHIPELLLESPVFSEPNPFNPAGNLRPGDVPQPFAFDLTEEAQHPRLSKQADGSVLVPAFTDLKRHDMGPELNNEMVVQAGIPTSQWLTRKLWGFANEPPFLHHGRALLVSDAILAHGGEAEPERNAFAALSDAEQASLIEFLKTLQVLPEGESQLEIEAE